MEPYRYTFDAEALVSAVRKSRLVSIWRRDDEQNQGGGRAELLEPQEERETVDLDPSSSRHRWRNPETNRAPRNGVRTQVLCVLMKS